MTETDLTEVVLRHGSAAKAKFLQSFFRAVPGGYGEGDRFAGVNVPVLRQLAKTHRDLSFSANEKLLHSEIHEVRLLALFLFVQKFAKAEPRLRKRIFDMYLRNLRFINNWDLIDLSAPQILGGYLFDRDRSLLYRLARSPRLWDRRIAVMATFHFIKENDFSDTIQLARLLLKDEEDLIHKACGWMLREVGKRDFRLTEKFVLTYQDVMPRTMLRYAIERFPEAKRRRHLKTARKT